MTKKDGGGKTKGSTKDGAAHRLRLLGALMKDKGYFNTFLAIPG
jgi:hypothetical protein